MSSISQAVQPGGAGRRQLWIAVALGLIAAVLAIVFLNSAGQDNAPLATGDIAVVVAEQQIAAGERITESMLTMSRVPEVAVAEDSFRERSLAVGQIARYPLARGEQVSPSRLVAAPQVQSLSFQIPEGQRAMTMPVSTQDSPATLTAPGDFVDVIISVDVARLNGQGPATGRTGAATLLQNIQVLSVDRSYVDTGVVYDPSVRGEPPGERDSISFVTLSVTPEQAQLLWLAQDSGRLTLILRPFGEDSITPLAPIIEPLTLN